MLSPNLLMNLLILGVIYDNCLLSTYVQCQNRGVQVIQNQEEAGSP